MRIRPISDRKLAVDHQIHVLRIVGGSCYLLKERHLLKSFAKVQATTFSLKLS